MSDYYQPMIEFIDETKEFANGFECGMVWQQMKTRKPIREQLVRQANAAQIQMMGDFMNVTCDFKAAEDGWAFLTVTY